MNFSQRIKRLRNERRWTQEQVSTKLNIKRSTYAKYETGENQPDNDTLAHLARLYEVTIDYLVTGSVSPIDKSANEIPASEYPPELSRMWDLMLEKLGPYATEEERESAKRVLAYGIYELERDKKQNSGDGP